MAHVAHGERYKSALLTIPGFGVQVRAIAIGRKVYFPVRAFCMVLGLGWQTQKTRLKEDSRFIGYLRDDIPVETARGYRDTLCLHKDRVADWLTLIDPAHCKLARTRERLEVFQREVFTAADRFLWGDTGAKGLAHVGAITQLVTGVLHVGSCPGCGMQLCLVLDDTGAHLQPEPTDESE